MFFYLILFLAVILAAAGQVMLKFGAGVGGLDLGIIRLNVWVILGLGAMVMSMLLSVRGLSVVPMRDMAFILPTVYVLVPVFSRIFLKERLNGRTVFGTVIMIAGIFIFNMPTMQLF